MMESRKVTHPFYHMMEHISSESSHPPNLPLFYVFQLVLALYSVYRLSVTGYICQLSSPPGWYLPYDAFAIVLTYPTTPLDARLLPVLLMFELFIFYDYLLIYTQPVTSYSIAWFKEVVVSFQDKARQACLGQAERERISKETLNQLDASLEEKLLWVFPITGARMLRQCVRPAVRLWGSVRIWHSLGYFKRATLYRQSLSVQPNLSCSIRRLLLLSLQVAEWASFASQVIVFLTVNIFFLGTYLRFGSTLPWTAFAFIPFDVFDITYQFYQLINLGLFFTVCTLISGLINVGHCRAICRQLQSALSRRQRPMGRHSKRRRPSPRLPLPRLFSLFLADYYRCIGLATYGNGQLFSRVLFAFFLTNLPINIHFITQIVFNSKDTVVLVIATVICLFQALASYAVLGPLAFFCAAMHRPAKILPVVQQHLGTEQPGALLLKLKVDNLLFRLLHHPRITISVGPLSAVTHSFILEFLAMYGGYLLMAFSMHMKAQQKRNLT